MGNKKVMKNAVILSEAKYDAIIKPKQEETRKKELDRNTHRNNIIVYGVAESQDKDGTARKQYDRTVMDEVLEELHCAARISNVVMRLGKNIEEDMRTTDTKPRPLKVVLTSELEKNDILEKARDLKKTKYKNLFIVQDSTTKERAQRKVLVAEEIRE